jgi:hypothetical protein
MLKAGIIPFNELSYKDIVKALQLTLKLIFIYEEYYLLGCEHHLTSTRQHGVTSQQIVPFIITTVGTSNSMHLLKIATKNEFQFVLCSVLCGSYLYTCSQCLT